MVHSEMHIEAIPLQFCRTLAEIIRRILSEQQQLAPDALGACPRESVGGRPPMTLGACPQRKRGGRLGERAGKEG